MKSCNNNGSHCCIVDGVLSRKVDTLVIAFALIGILITVNHAYADDGTSSSGTDASSSGGSSGTTDSSSQSSSSSTSTTSDSSSSNTNVNTPSTTGSSDTSSSSSSGPTNKNQIPSNSENTATSNQTTDTSSNSGITIDSGSVSSTNTTTNSTDATNSGETNSTNSDNSTNNSNDTGSTTIIYVNSTDRTTGSYTQTNSTNSSHHLLPILNHLPSKIIPHMVLYKKILHHNIAGTVPLQLDMLAIKANMVGQVEVKRVGNQTLLGFSGEEYFAKKISSTNNLKGFSLSAWVKPDYSRGSSQLTIVSKENAFVLGINNDIKPERIAQFSIFNGIKWNTVQSLTQIDDQKWTHLAVTFNGNTSSIYVNGKLESSIAIEGIPSYSTNGLLETIPVKEISSDSSLMVGASEERYSKTTNQHFSGLISDLKMYDLPLGDSTIAKISQTNLPITREINSYD